MAGNFSNLLKNISLYSHESQQTPHRISMERYRHHSKNADGQWQEENLERNKRQTTCYHLRRNPNKISLIIPGYKGDQRQWDKISKVLKEKNLSTKNPVFSRTRFQKWRQNRHSQVNQNWENLLTVDPHYKTH